MAAKGVVILAIFYFLCPRASSGIKIGKLAVNRSEFTHIPDSFLGAVFRTVEDSHLSETFRWAVEWGRKHMYTDPKAAAFLEYKIEYVKSKNFEDQVAQKGNQSVFYDSWF